MTENSLTEEIQAAMADIDIVAGVLRELGLANGGGDVQGPYVAWFADQILAATKRISRACLGLGRKPA